MNRIRIDELNEKHGFEEWESISRTQPITCKIRIRGKSAVVVMREERNGECDYIRDI